tara:strand:- start:34 stop:768 length:735 start_codon:yes stop_codon:yes gene_type:complete
MMKVTLITISYNASQTIKNTLMSVKSQTHTDIEHLIIDGNSTDDTLLICKEFPHISKIISEPDKGVYDAFNKGLKLATGQIVGFLNSDDVFYDKNTLQIIVEGFDEQTHCVFGNLDYTNANGKVIRKWRSNPYQKGAFTKGWMPAHPTFYCRKEIYDRLGGYDESFQIAGDFELALRFLEKNGITAGFINKTLVKMRAGGISNSGIKSKIKILLEEFRAFEINRIKINKLKYIAHKALKIKEFF